MMKKIRNQLFIVFISLLFISSCIQADNDPDTGRWYSEQQVKNGQAVFVTNCSACHGKDAQGTFNWRKPLPDGKYPPPPLNGAAHAWHHPLSMLKRTVNNGGIALGGTMPPFADKLTDAEIESAISFFQSYWSDEIYLEWLSRGGLK